MAQWEHSLSEAVRLNPAHVSIYDLQIESGTVRLQKSCMDI